MSLIPAFEIGIWNAWVFMVWLLVQNVVMRLVSKEAYQRAGNPPDMKMSNAYKVASYISMPLWFIATAYSVLLPLKIGTIWFTAGLIIFLPGLVVNIIATINFATASMTGPISKGLYRFSRHPLYASLILIYLGVAIASASWIFLLITAILVVLVSISVEDEERYCLEKYGQSYREYINNTPKWLGLPK